MPSATIELKGAKELDAALRELARKAQTSYLRKGLRAGAKVVQGEAKARVGVKSGRLRRSIRVRAAKGRAKGEIAVKVTTSDGDNLFAGDEFYGGFVEKGHRIGKRPGKGITGTDKDTRAAVPAHPFLGPALDSKAQTAADKAVETMWALIRADAKG